MPSAAFTTLGCKVNQYETQKILESFEAAGFAIVPFDQPADVFVINSCSVTSIAESKSRYTIRKAARTNPNAKVVVTGCAAQMSLNRAEEMDGAHLVVPNPEKLATFGHFERAFPGIVRAAKSVPAERARPGGRTRATLKVQDGCSVMCSYCSIPYTRPGLVSRPFSDVMSEAEAMVEMGYRELILTGVLIGDYGPNSGSGGPDFEDLVDALADRFQDRARIRISSIEMRQVTPRLIDLVRTGKVCAHLHIPLQSGDSGVLADMNRPYSQADYLDLVARLYREIPDFSLTTDIMVGFPTETAERFRSTEFVCGQARYLKVHAFRFSPRFGTPADAFGDPVSTPDKQARSLRLAEISARTGSEHAARFVGRTMRVLVEGKTTREGLLEGLTDNYLTVIFAGPTSLQRDFAFVTLHEARDGMLYGELSSGPEAVRPLPVVVAR